MYIFIILLILLILYVGYIIYTDGDLPTNEEINSLIDNEIVQGGKIG